MIFSHLDKQILQNPGIVTDITPRASLSSGSIFLTGAAIKDMQLLRSGPSQQSLEKFDNTS